MSVENNIMGHNNELDKVRRIIKKLSDHLDNCKTCHVLMILKEIMEEDGRVISNIARNPNS
jgi:hypothetical protein